MKTPREILLERHRAAGPQLDAVRRDISEQLNNQETKQQSPVVVSLLLRCLRTVWHELIWPARRLWAGLAATWVVILSLNFYTADHTTQLARQAASPSPELRLALREQRRELARLIEPGMVPVSEQPKSVQPSPRSERRDERLAA